MIWFVILAMGFFGGWFGIEYVSRQIGKPWAVGGLVAAFIFSFLVPVVGVAVMAVYAVCGVLELRNRHMTKLAAAAKAEELHE